MKSISLILCLLFCYQAFAKKPVDHGRVLQQVDFNGVTTFTPKSGLGLNEAPSGLKRYDELYKKNKLPELIDLFNKDLRFSGGIGSESAADYALAFSTILSASMNEGHIMDDNLMAKYLKAYNDLVKALKLDRGILEISEFESRDNYGKLSELQRLFEDLSYQIENSVRVPEDNL